MRVVKFRRGISIASPVYVDSNLLVAAHIRGHQYYLSAATFLFEVSAQGGRMLISTLCMDEAWWALLREWHYRATGETLFGKHIKKNRAILGRYSQHFQAVTNNVLGWKNVSFLPRSAWICWRPTPAVKQIARAVTYLSRNDVPPRDAFHLALAGLAGARSIVTCDPDFDDIDIPEIDLVVYKY